MSSITEKVLNMKPELEPNRVFRYVDISSIDNVSFSIGQVKEFLGKNAPSRARRPIKAKDTLFSNVRTNLKNIAIVEEKTKADICSTGFTVLRPTSDVEPKYLFRYVLTDAFLKRVTPLQTGTHYPATSDKVVLLESIPLPPLHEQRAIVAKLENLLEKVEACQKRLDKIPLLLKRFRQSVLSAACSGRLTADWRERNFTNIQWINSTIESVAKIGSGNTSKQIIAACEQKGEIPWFRVGDMNMIGNEKEMTVGSNFLHQADIKNLRVKVFPKGTVIFPKRGGAISTNKKRILTKPSAIDLNTMALTPFGCDASYFWIWFSTINLGALADGSNVPQINNTDILPLEIPLPPTEEQTEIKKRVDELFLLADQIEVRYIKSNVHVEKLTQSVLAKAFRGELVDPITDGGFEKNSSRRMKAGIARGGKI